MVFELSFERKKKKTRNKKQKNPQGWIWVLFLLLYLCPKQASVYNRMTDDTNIFCSDRNIKYLFQKAKDKLQKISEWFRAKDKIHNFSQA